MFVLSCLGSAIDIDSIQTMYMEFATQVSRRECYYSRRSYERWYRPGEWIHLIAISILRVQAHSPPRDRERVDELIFTLEGQYALPVRMLGHEAELRTRR